VHGGGTSAPTDNGYTKIYSNQDAFAAIKADGSITAWGFSNTGGPDATTGSGYNNIYLKAQKQPLKCTTSPTF
jgi:hypothetical protein